MIGILQGSVSAFYATQTMKWLTGNCSSVWRCHSRCCKGQGAGQCPSHLLDCSLDLCSHHIHRQAVSDTLRCRRTASLAENGCCADPAHVHEPPGPHFATSVTEWPCPSVVLRCAYSIKVHASTQWLQKPFVLLTLCQAICTAQSI